jgi:hypothetical protein
MHDQPTNILTSVKKPIKWGLNRAIPFFSPVVKYMANSGVGTDECLSRNCLPVPVHYYSPIPNLEELERRKVWDKVSPLNGINFRIPFQIEFLSELGKKFGGECDWSFNAEGSGNRFCLDNPSFSFGCASALYSVIRYYQPCKIIEIGSGNSSLVIQEALNRNSANGGVQGHHIIVDPYLNPVVKNNFGDSIEVCEKPVECVDSSFFKRLQKNDILFIDSSHSVKMGSDVNYLILDILPILQSGVIVHFHDINLPYEYPKVYATNPKFRMFWTESYLLQAFLCCNNQYEILLAMNYLMKEHIDLFHQLFPCYHREEPARISGSFWIKKL